MEKKKNKVKKTSVKGNILKFLLLILILTLIHQFIFKTNFFTINTIEIIGNSKVMSEQIIRASMCNKGENMFRIDKKKAEKTIKEHPYIKEASIKRRLPKTIIIEVSERQEIAVIPYIATFAYIDDEGYILDITNQIGRFELPQIFGLELKDLEVGTNLFDLLKEPNIREYIKYSHELGLLPLMKYTRYTDNNVTIELIDEIRVAFGPLDNVKYKLSFLFKILDDIEKKGINVKQILLNKGDNPIVVTDGR